MGTISAQRSNDNLLHEPLALSIGSNAISQADTTVNPLDWIDSYTSVRYAEGHRVGYAVYTIPAGNNEHVSGDCTFSYKETFKESAYKDRIKYLATIGEEGGIVLNQMSVLDFNKFVNADLYHKKALLSLTDDGNIRSVWKDEEGNHIGIQFFGSKKVTYVIFKRRQDGSMLREVNVGNLEDMGYLIDNLGLF